MTGDSSEARRLMRDGGTSAVETKRWQQLGSGQAAEGNSMQAATDRSKPCRVSRHQHESILP